MKSLPRSKKITQPISCQGLTIRTNNNNEMTPATAKIGNLWQGFQHKFGEQMDESSQVYGVYHNYASDVDGDFDVTACLADSDIADEELSQVTIAPGDYLVFHNQGEMPQAVMDAWGDVWNYFAADCPHSRQYDTDFEKYISTDEVEIYISIN